MKVSLCPCHETESCTAKGEATRRAVVMHVVANLGGATPGTAIHGAATGGAIRGRATHGAAIPLQGTIRWGCVGWETHRTDRWKPLQSSAATRSAVAHADGRVVAVVAWGAKCFCSRWC